MPYRGLVVLYSTYMYIFIEGGYKIDTCVAYNIQSVKPVSLHLTLVSIGPGAITLNRIP